jgi:hypothetical protein
MRVSYQFSTGLLAITMYETPFRLSAEFKDLDGFSWHSSKYTSGSISKLKLINSGSKQFSTTMDERIASIWSAILRQPTINTVGNHLMVKIAAGVYIPLTKEKIKSKLEPVAESLSEYDEDCAYEHAAYDTSKCTQSQHSRCMNDISTISNLQAENERLRAEIEVLRRLTIRDNSRLMRDSTLTRGG